MRRVVLVSTLALFALACDRALEVPPPPATLSASSFCATDFSCPPGQECRTGSCAPSPPPLRAHIQLASALGRPAIDAAEIAWRASHYDLHIASVMPEESRAINPNVRMFEYTLLRYPNPDTGPKNATSWAIAHGYDPENFYLHYRVDTMVPTWEGKVIVPGFPAGMVPGWNPGGPEGPATALTRAQSRVVGYYTGLSYPGYLSNMEDPGYREFFVERTTQLVDGRWWYNSVFPSGPIDGIMCDEAIYYPLFQEGQLNRSDEYYGITLNDNHPYAIAIENFYPFLSERLLQHFNRTIDVMPNYGHVLFLNYPNRSATNIQAATPWIWGEVWVTYTGRPYPTSGSNRCITYEKDYANAVTAIITQTRSGGRRVVGARDLSDLTLGTGRGKIFTLGLYYLLANSRTYYNYETVITHNSPGHISTWSWNPAVEYNVGAPMVNAPGVADFEGNTNTNEHYVFASGPDPYAPALTYRVLARRLAHALVLVKMLPDGSVDDSRSVTVHNLGGSYRPLLSDGTLGGMITQIALRNNEAAILVPQIPTGVN